MKTMTTAPSRMRGLSVAGWMYVIVTLVVFGTAAAKLIPPFAEYTTVKGIINSVMDDPKLSLKSEDEVLADINKRFYINNVRDVVPEDFEIIKDAGSFTVSVDYETRANFMRNVDFVVVFKEDFIRQIR